MDVPAGMRRAARAPRRRRRSVRARPLHRASTASPASSATRRGWRSSSTANVPPVSGGGGGAGAGSREAGRRSAVVDRLASGALGALCPVTPRSPWRSSSPTRAVETPRTRSPEAVTDFIGVVEARDCTRGQAHEALKLCTLAIFGAKAVGHEFAGQGTCQRPRSDVRRVNALSTRPGQRSEARAPLSSVPVRRVRSLTCAYAAEPGAARTAPEASI